ncbi:MAG: flagellar basal body P-ring protein FlgI, partial [Desulfobacteraceae bacterium]
MRNRPLSWGNIIAKTVLALLIVFILSDYARAARIKELTKVKGVRENQLIGYGLVVGLSGTGDGKDAQFTFQSLTSLLERMGVTVDPENVEKIENVAAVMVTAD